LDYQHHYSVTFFYLTNQYTQEAALLYNFSTTNK